MVYNVTCIVLEIFLEDHNQPNQGSLISCETPDCKGIRIDVDQISDNFALEI